MKLFSSLQGIKSRSSASDNKFDATLKELKQMLTDSNVPKDEVTKIVSDVKTCQAELKANVAKHNEDTLRLFKRLHEEILESNDVKLLESAIQNQSALTAKSVVETLRGDSSFSRLSTTDGAVQVLEGKTKDFEERMVGHFVGFVGQMEKISGISTEILNSVEDIKQLTRFVFIYFLL